MRSAKLKNDSSFVRISCNERAAGVRETSRIFSSCNSSAVRYGRCASPSSSSSHRPRIESMISAAQSRQPDLATGAPQHQAGPAAFARHDGVVAVEFVLLRALDRAAVAQHAESRERLEEPQLVLVDAHRVEDADVERAHLDVLHAGALQRPGRTLAAPGHALRTDEAVVLVLDLQDVGVQLAVLAVHLDADLLVLGIRRADRGRQVAHVVIEAVDRDVEPRLALVAVAEVAHAQRGRIRRVRGCPVPAARDRRPCVPAGTTGTAPGELPNRYSTIQPCRR